MTRIIHLSDLHFGYHREDVVAPLLANINRLKAELVIVTGDVSHRARPDQFQRAREFLDAVEAPVMVIPGNHDIPLYNLPARFGRPYAGYQRSINQELAPKRSIGDLKIWGLNTVDPRSWRKGIFRPKDVARLARNLDPKATNIIALHHPLEQLPEAEKELARGAIQALAQLEKAGADIVLSGHLHVWVAEDLLTQGSERLLQIQAGTALCARNPNRNNEFVLLDVSGGNVEIERYVCPVDAHDFSLFERLKFSLISERWVKAPSP